MIILKFTIKSFILWIRVTEKIACNEFEEQMREGGFLYILQYFFMAIFILILTGGNCI